MKRIIAALAIIGGIAAVIAYFISAPAPLAASALPDHQPDLKNGELLYTASGCGSCHKAGEGAENPDLPSGGAPFKTPVATFYPPNLTPDPETGIGNWSEIDFVNAVKQGISPDGRHYIPAFPYTSYTRLSLGDLLDIRAFLMGLPPVKNTAPKDNLPLAWIVRRGTGLWKRIAFDDATFTRDPSKDEVWNRGAYLVNGAGHCGECHTPRNIFFAPDKTKRLAGGPHPEGTGKVPSLRRLIARERFKDEKDLVTALQWGEAFGYQDMSSGGMGAVQENLSKLPESDLTAIARYLISLDQPVN